MCKMQTASNIHSTTFIDVILNICQFQMKLENEIGTFKSYMKCGLLFENYNYILPSFWNNVHQFHLG